MFARFPFIKNTASWLGNKVFSEMKNVKADNRVKCVGLSVLSSFVGGYVWQRAHPDKDYKLKYVKPDFRSFSEQTRKISQASLRGMPLQELQEGILDVESLEQLEFERAKKVALGCLLHTDENLSSVGVKDQALLEKVAFSMLDEMPWVVARCIDRFGIKNQEVLERLALDIAFVSPDYLRENIDKFGIENKELLKRLEAHLPSMMDRWDVNEARSANILGIKDLALLEKLAFRMLDRRPLAFIQDIDKFGIKDQDCLERLAFRLVEKGAAASLAEIIDKFGIKDQDRLERLAFKLVERCPKSLGENIHKFGIKDPVLLEKIAFKILDRYPWVLADGIRNFGIKDQDCLKKLALRLVDKEPEVLAENIHNFGIKNAEFLEKLAFKMADKDPWSLIFFIKNFGIKDQGCLERLALKLIDKEPAQLVGNIDRFGIKDQALLEKLAFKAADKDSRALVYYVKDFGVKDQALLEKLVFKAADKDPWAVVYHVKDFGIKDQACLERLALKLIDKAPEELARNIDKFGIKDQSCLLKIAKKLGQDNPEVLREFLRNTSPELFKLFDKSMQTKYRHILISEMSKNYFWDLSLNSQKRYPALELAFPGLDIEGLKQDQVFNFCLKQYLAEKHPDKDYGSVLNKVFAYRGRAMVSFLLNNFMSGIDIPPFLEAFDHLTGMAAKEPLEGAFLPAILPAKWMGEVKGKRVDKLFAFFEKNNSSLKEHKSPLCIAFLTVVNQLETMSDFSVKRKIDLINNICSSSEDPVKIIKALRLVSYFIRVGEKKVLKNLISSFSLEKLESEFKKILFKYVSIPELSKEEIVDRYEKTFAMLRVPFGLETYSQVHRESESSVKRALETFVRSVFLDTFQEERYRTDNNPHLKKVEESTPELFEKWKDFSFEKELDNQTEEKVVYTTKWQDLFVLGSESRTCQRLDGSATLNRCLLAYCLDGKNGMIAVQDEEGKTVARAILRLLWDEKAGKPVLFLETRYSNSGFESRKEAILSTAKKCGEQLGCKVFIEAESSGQELSSLGSSCPYEYVDAASGVMRDGIYTVEGKEI